MENIINRYAKLLVNYCLDLKPGERLYVRSTTLAEPLVAQVYQEALRVGAVVETELEFMGQDNFLLASGTPEQLAYTPTLYKEAMTHFDAYLFIRAPFILTDDVPPSNAASSKLRQEALAPLSKLYFERTSTRALKRCLCQFPTPLAARQAGLSLEEYQHFVYNACRLFDDNPIQSWLEVRHSQQHIVDHLNQCTHIRYLNDKTDIQFSTAGRTWINSDGQTNMPSGEVYTSPVEDSVQGVVHFDYPAIYQGREIQGVTLWVEDGYITRWEAAQGQDVLDEVFQIAGTRRFGEAAIGTNYRIDRFTKNILFDEKIGGTVHMAIGQSYLQTGGKNESTVHWDMIAGMTNNGQIWADGVKIYEKGQFLLEKS